MFSNVFGKKLKKARIKAASDDKSTEKDASAPSEAMVSALKCFAWLLDNATDSRTVRPWETRRGLYCMAAMESDHWKYCREKRCITNDILNTLYAWDEYHMDAFLRRELGMSKYKGREHVIETSCYKSALSGGPLPPPRWTDVFFLRRTTAEWTQKCKELVVTLKKLSEVEVEQLDSILHLHEGVSLSVSLNTMPESFLQHSEFLEGFKKIIIGDFYHIPCYYDPDFMIKWLQNFFDIKNPALVKKLLYSDSCGGQKSMKLEQSL